MKENKELSGEEHNCCHTGSLSTSAGFVPSACINPDMSIPMLGLSCSIPNTDTVVTTKAASTEVSSNVFMCLDKRLDASLLFFLPALVLSQWLQRMSLLSN